MNQNNNSFFLFGGSFLTRLKPRLEKQGTVAAEWMGLSPLSQLNGFSGELKPWLPELDAALAQAKADYLIVDLQCARQNLLVSGGCYLSASEQNLSALKRKELAAVDPGLLPRQQVEEAIDSFAAVLRKRFAPDRIILLHTCLADFWLAGNNLRTHQPAMFTAAQKKWMAELEQQFRSRTGCRLVDVSRFYFLQKEPGRPLTEEIFEDRCYQDVAGRVADILSGGTGRADRPDFGLSLDRYVDYHFTMQRKPQRVYLDANYFLDNLILCAQPDFVTANRESLIALDALDWYRPENALAMLKRVDPDGFLTKICVAFHAVRSGRYGEPGVDYALLFRSGIAPEELITYLKKEYAPKAGLMPGQINQYNAGYHFAKLRKLDPASCSTALTVAEPTVVDVFGSCISRTLFNVQDNDFTVNRYWFHVPPFEYRNKPVACPPALFPEKLNWTDRLVRLQFEGGVYQDIRKSEAKWLVLDLYSLISPNTCLYQDCLFGDFDHRISNALKAQRVDIWRTPNLIAKDHDELLAALNPFLEVLRSKYGSRIILVDGQRQDHWLGDDGRIYALPRKADCNEFMDRAFHYVQEKIGCYGIRIGQYFLPDELGYMRNTPAHKEDLGYFAAHDTARYIVDQEPKQKLFEQYSGRIHMAHLERLMEHNSPAAMALALPLTELDRAVLALGLPRMRELREPLSALYDSVDWTEPLKKILIHAPAKLADALRGGKTSWQCEQTITTDYEKYPSTSGLPVLPKVRLKRIVNERGGVAVSWTAPAQTVVRIYRSTAAGPWVLVGKSGDGLYRDNTVAAETDYRYTLCTETVKAGRCWLGSFTKPVAIRTALDTPVLLSAIHSNGVNTLRWARVPGAEHYWVYHKSSQDQRWQRCAVVDGDQDPVYQEKSQFPEGGEWYTVRALNTVEGKALASGFQPGLPAEPL